MKRLYVLLSALLLLAFMLPAEAAWNIRQKGTGGAVWIDQNSVEVPIGSAGIVVSLTHLGAAVTTFVVTNKPGKLRKIWAVANGAFASGTTGPNITFQIAGAATTRYIPISTGANLRILTAAGMPTSLTPADLKIDIVQGGTLAIVSDGTGGASSPGATLTIVIE